jgi:uncharacterized protein (DUF433 family)
MYFYLMVNFENDIKLGNGIYSIPDLSLILRLPSYKISSWLNDFWDVRLGDKYREKYSWGDGRNKSTNFHTLIEFYVFYQLRKLKVGTKTILHAHEIMAEQLNTPYPFASSEVLTDGKRIIYSIQDGTTINADKSKQIVFKQIIESFCKKIEFSESHLAERYWPLGKGRHIVVDPHHQFGQPVIEKTNLLAETIHDLHSAGESKQFLARLYNITLEEVNDAIDFYNPKIAA